MKQFVREVGPYAKLYRDSKNGIAWIEDGSTGLRFSCHSNIDASGSVEGMKNLGYWRKTDRIIRSHGFAYNIDTFGYSDGDKYSKIAADECRCQACIERKEK